MAEVTKSLTIRQILDAKDREPIAVQIPEWGGVVYLRAMDAFQSAKYSELLQDPARKHSSTVLAVQHCLVDEAGNQLVPDEFFEEFKRKNWGVIQRLGKLVMKMNGVTNEEETKQVVEEVKKT